MLASAAAPTCLPVAVEPVKVILSIPGCRVRAAPTVDPRAE